MPRIVLIGTATTPYLVRARDLPADRDLRDSFFRWCDWRGVRNLSGYDLRNSDWLDCDCAGVIWPDHWIPRWDESPDNPSQDAATDFCSFRRCRMTGAVLPANASSFHHDFVTENWRRKLATLTGREAAASQHAIDYLTSGYDTSWPDGYAYVMAQMGATVRDVYGYFYPVLAGFPRWQERLRFHANSAFSPDKPLERPGRISTQQGVVEYDVRARLVGSGLVDRYIASRGIELAINTDRSLITRVWFGQLDPWPFMVALTEDSTLRMPAWGWWPRWPI